MLLAVDIGNTNIVASVCDGDSVIHTARIDTNGDIVQFFDEIAQAYPTIERVIMGSVVPSVDSDIVQAIQQCCHCDTKVLTHENIGVSADMDHPQEVGADRLINAAAIIHCYKPPAIVIDFGTATTFDIINADHIYCGGVIAPGINLSLQALHQAAAKLPDIPIEKPVTVVGKNTVMAMQSGLYWGYISLIEGIASRIKHEMGLNSALIIATGGLAPLISQGTDIIDQVDQDLTIKGMIAIDKNLKI